MEMTDVEFDALIEKTWQEGYDAAKKESEALRLSVESIVRHGGKLQAEIVELCAEIKDRAAERGAALLQIGELRKALAFYADEKEWRDTADNYGQVWVFDWPGDLGDNPWDIAKAALGVVEKPKCLCNGGPAEGCKLHPTEKREVPQQKKECNCGDEMHRASCPLGHE